MNQRDLRFISNCNIDLTSILILTKKVQEKKRKGEREIKKKKKLGEFEQSFDDKELLLTFLGLILIEKTGEI